MCDNLGIHTDERWIRECSRITIETRQRIARMLRVFFMFVQVDFTNVRFAGIHYEKPADEE